MDIKLLVLIPTSVMLPRRSNPRAEGNIAIAVKRPSPALTECAVESDDKEIWCRNVVYVTDRGIMLTEKKLLRHVRERAPQNAILNSRSMRRYYDSPETLFGEASL